MNNLHKSILRVCAAALMTFLLGTECFSQFVKEYQFSLSGENIGFFDSGSSFVDSTVYFDYQHAYSLDSLAADLGIQDTLPFNWTMDLEIIDLAPMGGDSCCGLGTIGYNFDMHYGYGVSMWMQHQVENGEFSINYPMGLSLSIPEYNRGDIITISLDSIYGSTPTLGITNPTLTKDLKTSFNIAAHSSMELLLGPFDSMGHVLFDFDETHENTLLHVGADGFSGELGLVTTCAEFTDPYSYDLDSDNDDYDDIFQSNICMALAPCLNEEGGIPWYQLCGLTTETWFTTALQLSLDWPLGLSFTLDYPDDEIVENIPNWATGVLSAQTADPVPYIDLGHNYLDMLEGLLQFGCPSYPSGEFDNQDNAYVCAALLAVDNRKTADNDFLVNQGVSDGERISVWNYMTSAMGEIMLPWGQMSIEDLAPFDFWVEYNLLDLESHFTITNEFGVEYEPEVRVKLQFSEEVEYKINPSDDWSTATVIDMPLEGDFQLKTHCNQYELNVVPEPYLVTSQPDMTNTGTDSYDTYLDVDALNFNVGVNGANIIPAYGFEFLCFDYWSDDPLTEEDGQELVSCALAVMAWISGADCCIKKFFGSWPWEWNWKCTNCWKETGECETCYYGFEGLTLPSYDMAADICSTSAAFEQNEMCGYSWRIPFSSTEDQYAQSNWLVDDVTFNETTSDAPFVGDSLKATAIPFELTDVSPVVTAMDYGFQNAIVQVERIGGVTPLTMHAEQSYQPTDAVFENPYVSTAANGNSIISFSSLPEHGDVSFQLNGQDEFNSKPSLLMHYSLQDDNGCFADFVSSDVIFQSFGEEDSDVSDEMVDLGIPYLLPNEQFCGDSDDDGCNDCSSGAFDVSNDGADYDGDGICNIGDLDDDGDGIVDNADSEPLNEFVCSDLDSDGCDDCSSGSFDMANDGTDTNGDGICDSGDDDIDGDGASNEIDTDDSDIYVCGDTDNDGCEDCVSGSYAPLNDGADFDADGLCDFGDPDIDNDGVANSQDPDDYSLSICGDSDADGCDDCNSGVFDLENDGTDTDGDGICDTQDPDIDGDGALNDVDSDDYNDRVCSDTDNDGCDDCQSGIYNPAVDGPDYDGDGLCNSGDDDIDGDGRLNADDPADYNGYVCGNTDGDGCDDCVTGLFNASNDGPDMDGDGLCDSGDWDVDGDGINALIFSGESYSGGQMNGSSYVTNDPDDSDPYNCLDFDDDGCNDCSILGYYVNSNNGESILDSAYYSYLFGDHSTGEALDQDMVYVVHNDGVDSDADGICDGADAFPNDATKYLDQDQDGVSFYNDCDDDDDTVGEPVLYFKDADSDDYGDPNVSMYFCGSPVGFGYVLDNSDCDDDNENTHPGAVDICGDGINNDCDDDIDESCTPPEIATVSISPGSPTWSDTVTGSAVASDLDGDAITLTYVWSIDGNEVGSTSSLDLSTTGVLTPGATFTCEVTAFDGQFYSTTVSSSVTVN